MSTTADNATSPGTASTGSGHVHQRNTGQLVTGAVVPVDGGFLAV